MNWFCSGLIWTISMGFGHSLAAYCHDYSGVEQIDPGIRMGDSPVMLSAAKQLDGHRERPFAAAQGDTRGKRQGENAVVLPVHLVHSKEQGRAPIPGG